MWKYHFSWYVDNNNNNNNNKIFFKDENWAIRNQFKNKLINFKLGTKFL
ncbi:MAG: hypothetical protein N7Q72_04650 [Spiroplasma sp. Tabriz.8]|nr:hypothetical protein [Spiroplasma sp. Tabriz.8]